MANVLTHPSRPLDCVDSGLVGGVKATVKAEPGNAFGSFGIRSLVTQPIPCAFQQNIDIRNLFSNKIPIDISLGYT